MRAIESMIRSAQERAVPIHEVKDLAPLINRISQARIVMLGEATHGTHEFYDWRRLISEWLIVKHGFDFIAVEGEWPPCRALHDYILSSSGSSARSVLERFSRWPTWMWANVDVIRLAEWLRERNAMAPSSSRVGFYGLDMYSLFESAEIVLEHLERIDPRLARRARDQYACFDPFQRDEKHYALAPAGCEHEVIDVLRHAMALRLRGSQSVDRELELEIQQNARIVANAERYFRALYLADESAWNIRDEHMLETLDELMRRYGKDARAIVWAHNSHIGDYRATALASSGLTNLGARAREKRGKSAVALVGFGTYEGSVIASRGWGGPMASMRIPPARRESYEAVFHVVSEAKSAPAFYLHFDERAREEALAQELGHRAIGVVYDPRHEGRGNYVPTSLANRYDAFIFIDQTTAVEPLIQSAEPANIPETWPRGQ